MTEAIHLTDMQYKDANPIDTVQRIRDILKANNIHVTEHWNESKVPYCYSIRISVDGCSFGVNGKGLTKELALASGYGELMERLQLGNCGNTKAQKIGDLNPAIHPTIAVSAQELFAQNPSIYERIAAHASKDSGHRFSAKDALLSLADKNGMLNAISFINLSTGDRTLFPVELMGTLYSANGGAAGNTPEEAIVQAISEIVERHHHLRIIDESICLPDIPESELARYPIAHRIITFLRDKGLRVLVRDASLGTNFPVVCVYIIDPSNGKYHTHFGAYPIFEIALERALTESFQGRSLEHIAQFREFYAPSSKEYDIGRHAIELMKGTYKKSQEFFVGQCVHPYNPNVGFSGKDNRTLLHQCLEMFVQKGLDVLVLDSSALGFPTCRVLVPGYSETYAYRFDPSLNERKYSRYAQRAMSDPFTASMQDFIGFAKYMTIRHKFKLDRIVSFNFQQHTGIPLNIDSVLDSQLALYALGYCCYTLNQLSNARNCIENVLALGEPANEAYASCLCRYLELLVDGQPNDRIRQVLDFFHTEAVVQQLYDLLERGENLFAPLVLRCGPEHCTLCPLKDKCNRENVVKLRNLIRDSVHQLDTDAFYAYVQQLIE